MRQALQLPGSETFPSSPRMGGSYGHTGGRRGKERSSPARDTWDTPQGTKWLQQPRKTAAPGVWSSCPSVRAAAPIVTISLHSASTASERPCSLPQGMHLLTASVPHAFAHLSSPWLLYNSRVLHSNRGSETQEGLIRSINYFLSGQKSHCSQVPSSGPTC